MRRHLGVTQKSAGIVLFLLLIQLTVFFFIIPSTTLQLLKPTSNKPTIALKELVNNETKICFIHVGKTAGSRIRCELKQNRAGGGVICPHGKHVTKPPPSAMTKYIVAYGHLWATDKCSEHPFNTYLYTLRNPFDRLVSWYFYEHPRANVHSRNNPCSNKLHYWENNTQGCFKTIDEWARNCTPVVNETNLSPRQAQCQQVAYDTARGGRACRAHNSYNYDYYLEEMKKYSKHNQSELMLAIRTEHLAEDWDFLEHAFNGSHFVDGKARFHLRKSVNARETSVDMGNDTGFLSEEGIRNICAALCEEIQVYKQLLNNARNLNELQIRESLGEVVASCPEETLEIRNCTKAAM